MKKNRILIFLVLCLTISLSFIGVKIDVFALEHNRIIYEQKIYSNVTLEDDFDGSSVMVLLDKSISEVNKIHSKEFFAGVEIESKIFPPYIDKFNIG